MELFTRKMYSDTQLIAGIRQGGKVEDQCWRFIYRRDYSTITRHVLKNNGSEDEAIEIFQDAIVALYEKIKDPEFKLNENTRLSTYLFAIARNKWLYRQRGKRKMDQNLVENEEIAIDPWEEVLEEEKRGLLNQWMNKLGEDCRKILKLAFFEKKKMNEIAQLMSFKNEQIARNKKYKCTQYLKKIVIQSGELTNELSTQ